MEHAEPVQLHRRPALLWHRQLDAWRRVKAHTGSGAPAVGRWATVAGYIQRHTVSKSQQLGLQALTPLENPFQGVHQ